MPVFSDPSSPCNTPTRISTSLSISSLPRRSSSHSLKFLEEFYRSSIAIQTQLGPGSVAFFRILRSTESTSPPLETISKISRHSRNFVLYVDMNFDLTTTRLSFPRGNATLVFYIVTLKFISGLNSSMYFLRRWIPRFYATNINSP